MKRKIISLILGTAVLALGTVTLVSPKKESKITFATYTNGDAATYYNSIDDSQTGNTLLTALRTLNLSKRQSTVGYSSMGTTPSGQFKYTDYDTSTVQYDGNGQPYGTKISSFYTFTSATSWNREHVWPNSHGGGSGGDAGTPYPDADIHMPRPTISSENSSRGNSFFVEGMNHSSNGWDPYTAGYSELSRGEAARITFYCTLVNSKLILAPNNTTPSGTDSVTGQSYGSGHTMGNLETLIKWNINYPVSQREKNRNEGAEYLQGNRNAFVDHPEYACKIWGNVNSTIKNMCDSASWDTGPSVSISKSTASLVVDDTTTISATASDSSAITWTTSDATVVTVSSASAASGTNITLTAVGPGTATVTARATINSTVYSATCSVTVSSGGGGGGDTPVSDSYSILYTDLDTAYPTSAKSYTSASGLSFTAYNTANYSSKVQFKKSGGYIYNDNSLNLGTLTLSGLSGTVTVYAGTTRNPSTTTISGSNGVYDLSGYNYFKIINSSSSVATCSSITVGLSQETKTLSSISVSTAPTKLTYSAGEYFDPTGLVITRTYSDDSTDTYAYAGHTSEFTFSPSTSTALTTSNTKVTISYSGKSVDQAITVNAAKTLSSISIETAPTKTTYIEGEYFNPTGLVIRRTYSDSTYDTYAYAGHSSEFTFSPSTSTALATSNTKVTITYSGKSVDQTITVNAAKTLSSITVNPQTVTFMAGEDFIFDGTVTAYFSDSTNADVTSEATFSGYDMSSTGDQTVTASYTFGGVTKTDQYQISIFPNGGGSQSQSGSQRISASSSSTYYETGDICPTGSASSATATCTAFDVSWLKNSGNNIVLTYAEMRIYGSHSFTITPKENYEITSVILTANNSSYATAVGGGSLINCTKDVSNSTVTLTPDDGESAVGFTNSAQSRINYIVVNYTYNGSGSSTPILTAISVNQAPTKTTYTAGEYFDPTGLVINRTWTSGNPDTYAYAGHTSEFTFSPSLSTPLTTGITSVIIYYDGQQCSQSITVSAQSSTQLVASLIEDQTFYVGEYIHNDYIQVYRGENKVLDFTFFGSNDYSYQFTYSDASSGGAVTYKTFENAISDGTDTCSLTVKVQRRAYASGTEDLSVDYNDLPSSYQTNLAEYTATSGVKFHAYNCANYSSKMQFKASGGYFETTEAMNLKTLTINNRETNTLTVYASNTAGSFSTTISGTNDVYNLTGYSYFKVIRSSSGAAYCASLTITVSNSATAESVSDYIMYEDTNNQCLTKLTQAIEYLNALSASELTSFQTSDEYVISTARERLEAWARNQGKVINYVTSNVTLSNSKNNLLTQVDVSEFNEQFIIVIISVSIFGLSLGLISLKKKRDRR